ncbi:acyltransferase [bacterium]|nr:acyltransferase [bacterium]
MSRVNFSLADNSKVTIGNNLFFGSGNVTVTENSSLKIGNDCMFSYDLTFRVGDGHTIINTNTQEVIPNTGNVCIEDRVWIGTQSTILKNAQIANDTIIGACSVVTKKFDAQNVAIAGNPAKIVKENVAWKK